MVMYRNRSGYLPVMLLEGHDWRKREPAEGHGGKGEPIGSKPEARGGKAAPAGRWPWKTEVSLLRDVQASGSQGRSKAFP